jgi:hypothetical protein
MGGEMRPPRAVVEQAIRVTDGNITKTAALLGCTRDTVYRWIYQLGLQRLAGIHGDDRSDTLDRKVCPDARGRKNTFPPVRSDASEQRRFQLVNTAVPVDPKISVTIKTRESVWKKMRKKAIDTGRTTSDLVEEALLASLQSTGAERQGGA